MELIVAAHLCSAALPAGLSHERPGAAGGAAQSVDSLGASQATELELQPGVGSEGTVESTAHPVDEIATEIRFLSSCVTVGVLLFTLGVIGFVTFNPVPPRRPPLPKPDGEAEDLMT